ncbi:MAG: hypothetical protein A2233_03130 [Candidatus Kerfeldbacteria bacterium RIFOXYA2_FULL_38_24]|uniref:Uncharacterized protein n=1 Tax=Candidatus Kerfeldbacteria bacterium RIFOXYB2_FULL_38_14 TaxID=1798547 RepID=A0A1G2BC83_9BACT|nr:MAG: hypothetical protein A2233_03130 [Candidatus Kerfeldbacteria bacterium RIFOXYA2_FULL_38_24]OGY86189.1 MAG: hypothetical protein A2319_03330 [Candidatus Kerfeldbacteria bacterium RIFOXYB2_FULL_38_14]
MFPETKNCQNCKKEFIVAPEDFAFYEKVQVPAPTWCPECRTRRRLAWRNERSLYRRKCEKTGKEIFSMFHPSASVVVVDNDYWWGDSWDGIEYGKEIDWDRPLLEQFKELQKIVPRPARSIQKSENSDYCNNGGSIKDSYLVFTAENVERTMYSVAIWDSKDCMDCLNTFFSELCYGCVFCDHCYNCQYCITCNDSNDLLFCKNCANCSDCFGCVNLKNKQYCIFNEQYSPEEYKKRLSDFKLNTFDGVQAVWKKLLAFSQNFPVQFAVHDNRNVNCSGEFIYKGKNVQQSYFSTGENCKFCQLVLLPQVKDCYDYSIWGNNAELMYECAQVGTNVSRIKFSFDIYPSSSEIEYSMFCTSSDNLFLCAGLKKKKYCILNKQYTKEEYEALVPKLKQHMNDMPYTDAQGRVYKYGEFFPPEFLPYGYNETLAYELFPLTKEEAESAGYFWREPEKRNYQTTIQAQDIPQSIQEADDSITQQVIGCAHAGNCAHNCTTAFKILPQEFAFYRQHNIPLPRLCPNCRHHERIYWRSPIQMHERTCQCAGEKSENRAYTNTLKHDHGSSHCAHTFQTPYAPNRPEIVYCKECYQEEVA